MFCEDHQAGYFSHLPQNLTLKCLHQH